MAIESKQGQGLLEMIIAIGIILTGLFSTVTLVTASLNEAGESAARLGAVNLAREGVEVSRSIRDSNWLAGAVWNSGLAGAGSDRIGTLIFNYNAGSWSFNFSASAITEDEAKIYIGTGDLNPARNVFAQFSGAPAPDFRDTGMRRIVYLYPICRDNAGNESVVDSSETADCPVGFTEIGVDIRSTASWRVRDATKSVTVEEKIYDWR